VPDELMDGLAQGEDTAPEGTQQIQDGGEGQPAPEAQPRQYLEVDDPDAHFVKVTGPGGEELEVSFDELRRGYSRESDYTRKTQELAEQRNSLGYWAQVQQAMQVDPQATIALLARQHGMSIAQATQAVQENTAPPQFDDPLERQVWEQQQEIQRLRETYEQDQADRQLSNAIGTLQQQYGASDEDVRAVVQVAYQNGLGIEQFPMIFQSVAFQRLQQRAQASQAEQQRRAAETQRRQTAAQQAGQLVTTGSGTPGDALTNTRPADGTMSLRDAAEAALDTVGLPLGFSQG
jgi:hypothetical protein